MSVILVGTDGLCFCTCASKCVLGKCGSAERCSKEQLKEAGYSTLQVTNKKSEQAVHDAMCCDGKIHKLKIRDVKSKHHE
jgi:hypothetical protein